MCKAIRPSGITLIIPSLWIIHHLALLFGLARFLFVGKIVERIGARLCLVGLYTANNLNLVITLGKSDSPRRNGHWMCYSAVCCHSGKVDEVAKNAEINLEMAQTIPDIGAHLAKIEIKDTASAFISRYL
jgi:hypothetical protein